MNLMNHRLFSWIIFIYLCHSSLEKEQIDEESKYEENSKCTEHKGKVEADFLLHVPCPLIRIMEHLKQCPVKSFVDTFLSIRCSEKCASGAAKKGIDRIKERVVSSVKDSYELQYVKLNTEAKQLSKQLITLPANLTTNKFRKQSNGFDCRTYGYALRQYFIENQEQYAIRRLMIANKKIQDASFPLNENFIDRQITEFRCRPTIKTDQSTYHYFKYIIKSLRSLINESPQRFNQQEDGIENRIEEANNSSRTTITNLSLSDILHLFYPYVEMTDRFKRILVSHSYLSYFMLNYESLFTKESSCESNNPQALDNDEGRKFRFFGRKGTIKMNKKNKRLKIK